MWPGNYVLPLDRLRLKCITLLALATMMRPSDAAPMSQIYDPETGIFKSMILSTRNVTFHEDNSMTIIFHGIKNDYDHQGFEVNLPASENLHICPLRALKCYVQRTKYH